MKAGVMCLLRASIAALMLLLGVASAPALATPIPVSVGVADLENDVSGAKYTVCTRLGNFSPAEIRQLAEYGRSFGLRYRSGKPVCSVSGGASPRVKIYSGEEYTRTNLGRFRDVQAAYTVAVLLSSQGGTLFYVSAPDSRPSLRKLVERAVESTGYVSRGNLYMAHQISRDMTYNNANLLDVSQTYGPLIMRIDRIGSCRRLDGMKARQLPVTGGGREVIV